MTSATSSASWEMWRQQHYKETFIPTPEPLRDIPNAHHPTTPSIEREGTQVMHILKTGEGPSLEHLSVVVDICLKNRYTGPSRVSKIHQHQCSEICEHNKIVGWSTVRSCTSTRLSELAICVDSHGLESRREALQCPKWTRRQDARQATLSH